MNTRFRETLIAFVLVTAAVATAARGAVTYIGDDPGAGQLITAGNSGPDTANGGSITYGFTTGLFTNDTGSAIQVEIKEVNFWAENAGTLTPFVAAYNGAGTELGANFTMIAVGDPIAGSPGRNNAMFEVGGATSVVTVGNGETLAAGFHQSNGMVPWDSGSGDYLKENDVIPAPGETLPGNATWSSLGRGYKFNIGVERVADPAPPTDITLSNAELLPGSSVGTTVGTINSIDPNTGDNVFSYALVAGAGDAGNALFQIAGPRLETAATLGAVGTSYSVRVRSTDPAGLSFEKAFTLTVIAGEPPTAISLSSTAIATDAPAGAEVGVLATDDPDPADVHLYALVPGVGDDNNGAFTISGDRLQLGGAPPAGGASFSIRVRSTDLGEQSVEATFTILVIDPSVRISEFVASNSTSLLDEDGDSSDWIEIFNEQAEEVNLGGWYLTDDAADLTKWQFPSRALAGGSYLVVFASGKDRSGANDPELHTNFKLTSTGEFLALVKPDGETIASMFEPTFPPQFTDISYGASPDGSALGYFANPSPREANGTPSASGVNSTEFSVGRGFYDAPFDLTLTPSIPGSTIRYTTNGSKPTSSSGTIYSAPLRIERTTTLRAISYGAGGAAPSVVATHSYVFVDDVVDQGVMSRSITTHPTWGPQMEESLLEIPTVSLVKPGGISTSETETSMELIFPDGTTGFQIDCGVEHFGGHSLSSPKKNMRMSFKKAYGPSRLNYDLYGGDAVTDFDQIILRTGSHDTWFWTHPSGHGGIFIRGRWAFDRQLEAGHVAPRGRWVHVYINGTYHGMHHLMERPNAAFMASYLGGEKEDYEALNAGSPIDGNKSTWNAMRAALGDYEQLQTMMDVRNYADYMLLQFYGGNDWDWNTSQNWSAASRKLPDASYKFFAWDSDVILRTTLNANVVNRGGPESMWSSVKNHDEFKRLLADRAQKFFFNSGMLTRDRVLAQFDELAAMIEKPIIAECARWGSGSYTPATWRNEINEVKNDLIAGRTEVTVSQIRSAGVFPSIDAPLFSQFGGQVPGGFELSLSLPANAAGGQIYYTINGGDPIGDSLPPGSTETTLLDQGAPAKALIPGAAIGDTWKGGGEPYNDASWMSGTSGIGYDVGSSYDPLIGLDLQAMQSENASAFVRIAFTLTPEELESVDLLRLDMKAEDGFVAYLNGVEIAALQKPANLAWNSAADGSTGDSIALQFQPYEISGHIDRLVVGTNILAFHILNQSPGSSDLLCLPRLVATTFPEGNGGDPTGQLYTGAVTLDESARVRARVQHSGEWSALEETFFYVDAQAPSPGDLAISEIHYNPQGADDAEFVEILNASDKSLILDGLQFSDGIRFTIPNETVLAPGGRAIVVGNEGVFTDRYIDPSSPWTAGAVRVLGTFTGSLDNGGEQLQLDDSTGAPLLTFRYNDSGSWPGRADGKGSSAELEQEAGLPQTQPALDAYLADGDNWRPSSEFHGSPGRGGSGPDNRVVFNEVLSHTDPPETDRFELLNASATSIDISGWYVSDEGSEYRKFQIAGGTTLDTGSFLTFDESHFNSGGSLIDFALDGAKGDDLFLLEADAFGNLLRFVDRVEFGAAANGEPFGRWPDGSGDLYPMRMQTFGEANAGGGNGVRVGPVVITEIMYNPAAALDSGLEFVEIRNSGVGTENLANWRLRGEADFDFAGEDLAPGGVLVIVGFDPVAQPVERDAFRAAYPSAAAAQLRGPWSAGNLNLLDNAGAAIRLQRPDALENPPGGTPFYPALVEDTVNYNNTSPWPTEPDGGGSSLERIDVATYGDAPGNWRAADPSPGTHALGGTNYEAWASGSGLGDGPQAAREVDFELDGLTNFIEFALDSDPVAFDLDKLPAAQVLSLEVGGETADYLTLSYRQRRDAPQLRYEVQVGGDLSTWQETAHQVGGPVDNGDGTDSVTIRDLQPLGAEGRRFIRLQVSEF